MPCSSTARGNDLRHDGQAVAGHALAGLALLGAVNDAVDAVTVGAEGEEGALEQALTAARYFLSSTRGGILACFWAEIIFSWYWP